jgi:hypothetical protein
MVLKGRLEVEEEENFGQETSLPFHPTQSSVVQMTEEDYAIVPASVVVPADNDHERDDGGP